MVSAPDPMPVETAAPDRLRLLRALERKVLWLSSWTIHHANHVRPNRDGLKVGGHQASSASVATILTALYFDILRPEDRVAVKPHASPVFHAIQYLLGRQSLENLKNFRALGGAQSYPSRTKDADDVDFSTGSVGLGAAMTSFAALVQDYLHVKDRLPDGQPRGRMVSVVGDAELDEGNVYEALLEGWKHDIRNVWWVIDYNRQSLDSTITDQLYSRFDQLFEAMGWRVVTAKYGSLLEAAFRRPGGGALRAWIDSCPNSLYAALCYKGGALARGAPDDGRTKGWREHLLADLGDERGIRALLGELDDAGLQRLMTNLAGHDMATVRSMFRAVDDDRPTCFIAYTIKGFGLPFEGHKDNHAGLMNEAQIFGFREESGIAPGEEWDRFAGLDVDPEDLRAFLDSVPFAARYPRRTSAPPVPVPAIATPGPAGQGGALSTQAAFGRILDGLARGDEPLADCIVTTSPDVTVSTNLGAWVNRRGIFDRRDRGDTFRDEKVVSAQQWRQSTEGQHIELGIAENNLFILLAALGLSHETFGARLLPIGTLYDPFIQRGLDALNYACYQGARFLLVATPSGVTLAPEGGAHQSVGTPLIGMAQDGLAAFEPAFADELAVLMAWSFDYLQRDGSVDRGRRWLRDAQGGSVYLRLSTRALAQPDRAVGDALRRNIVDGAYWLKAPAAGAELALVYTGAVAPEAMAAWEALAEDIPGAGLLAVTSADRLNAGWAAAQRARQSAAPMTGSLPPNALSHIENLLAPLAPDAGLVTVIDGHPATLSWLGAVYGHRTHSLGVEHFGQSADIPDLYRAHRIDTDAILDACAKIGLERLAG
ncbi:MAG: transketolase [Rhodospirillaceae bacterium]|nr:transketolase [Rhodospirillaceae bacterium]